MIDIQLLRENPELIRKKSAEKQVDVDIDAVLKLDESRRALIQKTDELRQVRNELNQKNKGSRPSEEDIQKGKELKESLTEIESDLDAVENDFIEQFKKIPNLSLDEVPVGETEDENQVVKTWGDKPNFEFKPKTHAEIAEAKGWLDKERAAKVTGSRFAYLKGDLVKLQFAIINFVMDKLTDKKFIADVAQENGLEVNTKPFQPVLPPFMLRTELYDAMDRLEPREDRYKIEDEDLWLQGSAEHVLGSMHADEIFEEYDLPIRYLGYATSFRREAGTYGKDMEGMFRMHQFDKLEMECLTTPEESYKEHLLLIAIQEKLTQLLQLPYELMLKCTADIGKPNARGVDINMWMPGQNNYRETHTADYMTDYQARRLKTRFKRDGETQLVHTNDATAFALSRTPIAIIENYQTENGDVIVPEVLRPYMGGREVL